MYIQKGENKVKKEIYETYDIINSSVVRQVLFFYLPGILKRSLEMANFCSRFHEIRKFITFKIIVERLSDNERNMIYEKNIYLRHTQ